jgi:hypothetical protein
MVDTLRLSPATISAPIDPIVLQQAFNEAQSRSAVFKYMRLAGDGSGIIASGEQNPIHISEIHFAPEDATATINNLFAGVANFPGDAKAREAMARELEQSPNTTLLTDSLNQLDISIDFATTDRPGEDPTIDVLAAEYRSGNTGFTVVNFPVIFSGEDQRLQATLQLVNTGALEMKKAMGPLTATEALLAGMSPNRVISVASLSEAKYSFALNQIDQTIQGFIAAGENIRAQVVSLTVNSPFAGQALTLLDLATRKARGAIITVQVVGRPDVFTDSRVNYWKTVAQQVDTKIMSHK